VCEKVVVAQKDQSMLLVATVAHVS